MTERLPCMGQSEEQEIRPWKLSSLQIGFDSVPKFCPIVFFKFWSIRLIRNCMAFSGLFIPNCPQTHAITNTKIQLFFKNTNILYKNEISIKNIIITFPILSPLEKGWYGISLNSFSVVHGPQPLGLSWITGGTKCAAILNKMWCCKRDLLYTAIYVTHTHISSRKKDPGTLEQNASVELLILSFKSNYFRKNGSQMWTDQRSCFNPLKFNLAN